MSHRAATWLAWSPVALSLALIAGGIILARTTGSADPKVPYDSAGDAVFTLARVLTFSVVGAIVASRQPRNTIGWIFCSIGAIDGLDTLAGGYAEFWLATGWGSSSLGETAAWFSSWAWTLLVMVPTTFLLLLFPDGRLPSPRWRPVAWCAALGIGGFVVSYALGDGRLDDFPRLVNPYGTDSIVLGVVRVASFFVVAVSILAAAVSVIIRARHAGRVERQQIKWLAYGGAVVVGTIFVAGAISIWSETAAILVISFALLGLPVFTGIAIVKHRLYDIDLIINRTLVYSALTTTLVALYFGGIVVLQRLFVVLTDQESTLAAVASTLVIAALFSPLRRRIQSFIDLRFYRSKYDAAKALETFSAKLRDETDLDALSDDLVGVVRESMQPEHITLWLRPDTDSKQDEGFG